jgi:oligoendopeptidase F
VQAKYSEFEDQIHDLAKTQEHISVVQFNDIFRALTLKYDGIANPNDDNLWMEVPHFFNQSYYVFQYTSGMLLSTQIVTRLMSGELSVVDYLHFLEIGESLSPTQTLAILNIDIEKDTFTDAFGTFETNLEQLLGELS